MSSFLLKLSESLGKQRATIELNWMRQATQSPHVLQLMVDRRARGEPLQYILGTQPFGPLNILTRAPTLIPRPETEQWTSELSNRVRTRHVVSRPPLKMLDLCTGSGCIPLLLCHLLHLDKAAPPIYIHALGVDISASACQLARDNIISSGIPPGYSVDIQQKSIFDNDFREFLHESFRDQRPQQRPHHRDNNFEPIQLDILTANPPYISTDQWQSLSPDVKDWEDPLALLGDPPSTPENGGLTFYRRIKELISYPGIFSPEWVVAMEIGEGQAVEVVNIFDGFGRAEVWKDLWGKERAIFIYGKTPYIP